MSDHKSKEMLAILDRGGEIDKIPLVLDLDGTLLKTDASMELLLVFLKARLINILFAIGWLLRGRSYLKRKLAQNAHLEVETLPLNKELVEYAKAEAEKGRPVLIATASDESIAVEIARQLPFIAGVAGSDGKTNLKGVAKGSELRKRFPQGFDYAGNSSADIGVWKMARRAILVNTPRTVSWRARRVAMVEREFASPSRLPALKKSMRIHQWSKNLLVFAPAILSGRLNDFSAMAIVFAAFIALSLAASATYIVNDLWDLADDRRHWSKRNRPLASGALPIPTGILAAILLLVSSVALAFAAGMGVGLGICAYVAITLAYSFRLKQIPILDAFILASLFTLRLGIGILASGAPTSPWLLVFSMFFFGSLSFAKRHTEIARFIARGATEIRGRGYQAADLPLVLATGVSTGMAAVLIMVLYIINDAFKQSFYGNSLFLWGFPILLFGFMSRIWILCQRGQLNDDPVDFAIKDRASLAMGVALSGCFFLAWGVR